MNDVHVGVNYVHVGVSYVHVGVYYVHVGVNYVGYGRWKRRSSNAKQLTGVPFSEVKLSLLLNLERQSSFLGTWKADGPPGGGARAEFGEGRRRPWAAALRSGAPAAASSLDCTTTAADCTPTEVAVGMVTTSRLVELDQWSS